MIPRSQSMKRALACLNIEQTDLLSIHFAAKVYKFMPVPLYTYLIGYEPVIEISWDDDDVAVCDIFKISAVDTLN